MAAVLTRPSHAPFLALFHFEYAAGVENDAWMNVNAPGLITFGAFKKDAYLRQTVPCITTNLACTFINGRMADITHRPYRYQLSELPIFAMIGATGGLMGGLFNGINLHVSKFRKAYIAKHRSECAGDVYMRLHSQRSD